MIQTGERRYHGDETNVFREYEKKYRLVLPAGVRPARAEKLIRESKADFSTVIDFVHQEHNTPDNQRLIREVEIDTHHHASNWFSPFRKAYTLESAPGLFFVPNPFTIAQQKYWIRRCVKDYTLGNPTNISNLDGNKTYWSEWRPEYMENLRWASLGYHFQWTPRVYTNEHKGEFPDDLGQLVSDLALQFGFSMKAEAAIVNFYPNPKCYMGGHLDDAEDDMSKPIVSCTFGNTVVFMIGGRTRDVIPTAIFIRSGDVVLMSGEARYCYHAVPRMVPNSCPPELCAIDPSDPPDWRDCAAFIENARVNMNCRQVHVLEGSDCVK